MHVHAIRLLSAAAVLSLAASVPPSARAHCDTMNGPVVSAARLALEKGDVTPVLRWVRATDEPEIREAFAQTLTVRKTGPEAKALADRYFFETLVRVHRQGEGEPYTGLKLASTPVEPAIEHADRAIASGSAEQLQTIIAGGVNKGLQSRLDRLKAASAHADHNVDAGRSYVAAYVDFVHYVEGVHAAAVAVAGHPGHAEPASPGHDAKKE